MVRPALSSLAALVIGVAVASGLHLAHTAYALAPAKTTTTTAGVTPPPPPGPQSVDYGYDPAHDFAAADPSLTLPLGSLWSKPTPGAPVALLAAEGVDFVLVDTPNATAPTGAIVIALDPNSGATIWSAPVPLGAALAYTSGVLAVAGGGHIQAYKYGIGAPQWNVPLAGVAAITPAGGNFYADAAGGAGTAGTIDAINATSGLVLWATKPPTPGGAGPLAVAGDRLYRAESTQAEAFDRITGTLIWHQPKMATGGTAQTPTLWQTELFRVGFTPGSSLPGTEMEGGPLSDATGVSVAGEPAEIVSGNVGLQTRGTGLVASDLSASSVLWSSYAQPLGILNGDAITAIAGGIQLRNLRTGATDWSAKVPSAAGAFPTAVGNQELLIGTGGRVTALVPSKYAVRTATLSIATPYAFFRGAPASGKAVISEPGIELAQPLLLAGEPWPFKQFGAPTTVMTSPTGTLTFTLRPSLNTIYRISAPGTTAAIALFEIVALPHVSYRFGTPSGTHSKVIVTVQVPRVVRLAHHRVSLYLGVSKRKHYVLLGTGTLTGRAGRFSGRFRFALQRHVGASDFVTACFAGIYKQGMSFGDRLDRRCGAKRIRF